MLSSVSFLKLAAPAVMAPRVFVAFLCSFLWCRQRREKLPVFRLLVPPVFLWYLPVESASSFCAPRACFLVLYFVYSFFFCMSSTCFALSVA